MITRIVRVSIKEEERNNFLNYMNSFQIGVKDVKDNNHIDFFEDNEAINNFHIYTIWKSQAALNRYLKSDLNKDFKDKLLEWGTERFTAWTVENMFVPPVEVEE